MSEESKRDVVAGTLSSGKTFLTFAGVETFLLFQQQFPLREFCAFELVDDDEAWRRCCDELLRPCADAAAETGCGLITDSFVWRASNDYASKLGYDQRAIDAINRKAVERTRAFVREWQASSDSASATPVLLAADVGPRGDGYTLDAAGAMSVEAAVEYHRAQYRVLADSDIDLLAAWTITSVNEAVGIARAAGEQSLPVMISATVETDGRLPDGASLGDFIERVDEATDGYPIFYMVNCAHPTHLEAALAEASRRDASWLGRFRGFRSNASTKSHEELDNSTSLDRGAPATLAAQIASLHATYDLSVVGGCCGTDSEHLRAIANACSYAPVVS